MTPPKGITKWKTRFFYIKVAAVVANITLRNVAEPILAEDISLPRADTVEWFLRLRTVEFKKLDNSQLWVLRMMLSRPDKKARPVVREKSGGTLGALGDYEVKGAPKKHVEKTVRGRNKKKPEAVVVPPLMPQAVGISRSCFRRYTNYVVVSDTLEGLGVLGGGAGSNPADEKRKRKMEETVAGAGEKKRLRIQTKRTTAVSQVKPVVTSGK
ncbi:hypothetical protein Hdeb2414_s0003g00101611 [Helianthus debilis subsp. tardiflorus]